MYYNIWLIEIKTLTQRQSIPNTSLFEKLKKDPI